MSSAKLKDRWDAFSHRPFPADYGGVDINGVCVTMTDSFVAGCVVSFISCGSLDPERIAILKRCRDDLDLVLPGLKGRSHNYFAELGSFADEVLVQVVRR
jgi:hypothetical protein